MLAMGAPRRIWDDCLELEAYIHSHSANSVHYLDGEVPKMYFWRDTCHQTDHWAGVAQLDHVLPRFIDYPDEQLHLGKYLGPAIDVGLAMTAKKLQQNGEVVWRSTYLPLTVEEMADFFLYSTTCIPSRKLLRNAWMQESNVVNLKRWVYLIPPINCHVLMKTKMRKRFQTWMKRSHLKKVMKMCTHLQCFHMEVNGMWHREGMKKEHNDNHWALVRQLSAWHSFIWCGFPGWWSNPANCKCHSTGYVCPMQYGQDQVLNTRVIC